MPDIDTVKLAQDLIRCPSITPEEGGALDLLEKHLSVLGFTCHRLPFGEGKARVDNLYARAGTEAPHLCFAGHTDVVPIGVRKDWQHDPFGGVNDGEVLWGRGAVDMKGAIAAFVSAVSSYIESGNNKGSISFLITGDEEGVAINGTRKMLDWLRKEGETIDDCLVGEPTNPETLGEMIKIGRRGSVNVVLKMRGKEGHVAYPHLAQNPIAALLAVLTALNNTPLDEGNEHFQASHLEITTIDIGNETTNVIPASASARFNIRYNNEYNKESIEEWVQNILDAHTPEGVACVPTFTHSGDAFLTPLNLKETNNLTQHLRAAIESVTGRIPELSTSGGTSDARFIKDSARVVEFGLISQTMHKTDECVRLDDLRNLTKIYEVLLENYFS